MIQPGQFVNVCFQLLLAFYMSVSRLAHADACFETTQLFRIMNALTTAASCLMPEKVFGSVTWSFGLDLKG